MDKPFYFFLGGLCSLVICYWFVDPVIDNQQELIEKQDAMIRELLDENHQLLLKYADCALDQVDSKETIQDSLYEAHIKEADFCMQQAIKRVEQLSEKK